MENTPANSPAPQPTTTPTPQPSQGLPKTIIVAGVGLLAAVVVLFVLFLQPKPEQVAETTATPTSAPAELTLALESPTDGTLAVENEMLVRGTTTPGATVAIFTETDEVILETDSFGQFETTVQLATGINSLTVTAYSEDGQEKSVSLNVVYDDEV